MVWGQVASAGLGLAGSLMGRKAAKTSRRLAKEDRTVAGTAYEPINFSGIGGAGLYFGGGGPGGGGGYDGGGNVYSGKKSGSITDLGGGYRRIGRYTTQSDINSAGLSLGDLDPFRNALMGQAPGIMGAFENAGYGQQLQGAAPGIAMGGLGEMYGAQDQLNMLGAPSMGAFGQAYGDLMNVGQNPFAQDEMGQLMGAGMQNLMQAGQGFDQTYSDTLGKLRESARPGEELAGANFLQRMFDTGGRSTSGGALQTQQFAQGLAQADTNRQLQALGEARNQGNYSLNLGQNLLGEGLGIRGLQDDLLTSATNRFGGLANLNQGLAESRYDMGAGMGSFAAGISQLGQGLQNQPWQNVDNFMGAMTNLQNYAMTPARFAEGMMNNQASSRMGQAGMGNAGMNAPNAWAASTLGSLSNVDWGSAFGGLRDLFGRRKGGGPDTGGNAWGVQ